MRRRAWVDANLRDETCAGATLTTVPSRNRHHRGENADAGDAQQAGIPSESGYSGENRRLRVRSSAVGTRAEKTMETKPNEKLASRSNNMPWGSLRV